MEYISLQKTSTPKQLNMRYFLLFISFLVLSFYSLNTFGQKKTYSKVKIYLDNKPDELNRLSKLGVAIDHGIYREGVSFTSDFSWNEIQIMKKNGAKYEILIADVVSDYLKKNKQSSRAINLNTGGCNSKISSIKDPANFSLGTMGGYHKLNEMEAALDKMASLYPNLISVKTSIGTTSENRPIYHVKISDNPAINEDEPEVLYTALHHAREPASLSQLLYYMWYLLENYDTDPAIKHIIDNTELYIVPCVNPDGYAENQTNNPNGGGMHRKNKSGGYGVDLNRNYGYNWGYDDMGSSPYANWDSYRGPSAFSELETQAMRSFCQNHNFLLALNYHTFGNLLIYPWGYKSSIFTPDSTLFEDYSKKMTADNHYTFGTDDKTVGYIVNGSSDDWMYGDQSTKNKIISMTPECGDEIDFFWPASSKIIPISRQNLTQNIQTALFAGKYATVEDISPKIYKRKSDYIHFSVKRFGLSNGGNFSVSISPITNIASVGNTKTYNNISILETISDSISFDLNSAINESQEFAFALTINNGSFSITDTITKTYGSSNMVFSDSLNSLANWTTSGWQITSSTFSSAPSSLTDSPNGSYSNNTNNIITLKTPINLANFSAASLSFKAKWDIESGIDYAQVLISTNNGSSWSSMCGKYSRSSTIKQDNYQPIYDGIQKDWVTENINLKDFLGKQILIRFRVVSDDVITKDGFYIDDIAVTAVAMPKSSEKNISSFGFMQPAKKGSIIGNEITVHVPAGTKVDSLIAEFSLSASASLYIDNTKQLSGVTANNFSSPINFTVIAEDGSSQNYLVTVIIDQSSSAKSITEFSFLNLENPIYASIDNNTITALIPNNSKISELVASFKVSNLATVKLGNIIQQSGVTINDFSKPVNYVVIAEDGSYQNYAVIITLGKPDALSVQMPNPVCQGQPVPNLTTVGTAIKWYSDAELTNLVGSGNSFAPKNTAAGSYVYFATQTINGIESEATPTVIIINQLPAAPISGGDQIAFEAGIIPDLTAVANNGDKINWHEDKALTTIVGIGSVFTTNKTTAGTYTYYITATQENCVSQSTIVSLTINTPKASWSPLSSTQSNNLLGISTLNANSGWTAGSSGILLKYDGNSWLGVSSGLNSDINAINFQGEKNGWAVGKSGKILKYNGTSWSEISNSSLKDLYAVYALDSTNIWMGGKDGIFKKYNGTSLSNVTNNNSNDIRSISFAGKTKGAVVGASGTIMMYKGSSWTNTGNFSNDFYSVQLLDTSTGWAVGALGTIVKYDGTSWQKIESGTTANLRSVFFIDKSNGWAAGDQGVLLHYDGTTWTAENSGTTNDLNGIHFSDALNGWAVGNSGTILSYSSPLNNVAPPVVYPQSVCAGETINAFYSYATDVKWYDDAALKNLVDSGNNFTPNVSAPGTYFYYVTQTINTTTSLPAVVTLTIKNSPAPPLSGGNISAVQGSNISPLTASGTNLTWYSDVALTDVLANGNSFAPFFPKVGTNTYYVTQTINNCQGGSTAISLNLSTKTLSSAKSIISFDFSNPQVTASINGTDIVATVPFGTDISFLVANFSSSALSKVKIGNSLQLSGLTANDFRSPITYTVIAEDSSTKSYTVTVNIAPGSSEKQILSFEFINQNVKAEITGTTIAARVPYGTDLSNLTASFTLSPFAKAYVNSQFQISNSSINDFTDTVTYAIVAQDSSIQYYDVIVSIMPRSSLKELLSFSFSNPFTQATINDTVITAYVPYNSDITAMIAKFSLSPLAKAIVENTVQISENSSNDFTNEVIYTIMAEDSSTQEYLVKVLFNPASSEKEIIDFRFISPAIQAIKNDTTITAYVPYGTDVSNLIANFTLSPFAKAYIGVLEQISGSTINNFSQTIVYSIMAQNSSTKNFTVQVIINPPSSEKEILEFGFLQPAIKATIKDTLINATMPFGTDLSNLVASFSLSPFAKVSVENKIQNSNSTINNFNNIIVYQVLAQDSSIKNYSVKVNVDSIKKSSEKELLTFGILSPNVNGEITGNNISINVPFGTDVNALKAVFTCSPLSIVKVNNQNQVSGYTENNFSNTITYTVYAQDGTFNNYLINVTVDPAPKSSEKQMIAFSLISPEITGSINGTFISLLVPAGTILNNLIAKFDVSPAATVKIVNTPQVSGINSNDFSSIVYYTVVAEDLSEQKYSVSVSIDPIKKSPEKDFLSFGFKSPLANGIISGNQINIKVPTGNDLSKLTASFTLSPLARAKIDTTIQISGTTANDFSNPVSYLVVAENGTSKNYLVTVTTAPEMPNIISYKNTACEGQVVQAINVTGSNLKWYADESLTTLIYSGQSFIPSANKAGDYNYFVTQTLDGQTSDAKKISIIINANPTASISKNDATCGKKNGSASLIVNSGKAPYSFLWSNGIKTATANELYPSLYSAVVMDSNGCKTELSANISSVNTGSTFYGSVKYNGSFVTAGQVELYEFSSAPGALTPFLKTNIDSKGNFVLKLLKEGNYTLAVKADENLYPNALKTYVNKQLSWELAEQTSAYCDSTKQIDFDLETVLASSGFSSVAGKVLDATGGKNPTNPIPAISILLKDTESGLIKGKSTSNNNGDYLFSNIAKGNYILQLDIPGLKMAKTYQLNFSDEPQILINKNFLIDSLSNIDILSPLYISDINKNKNKLSVNPNPYNNQTTITLDIAEKSDVLMELFSIYGKKLATIEQGNKAEGIYNYLFSAKSLNLASGMYFIHLSVNETHMIHKIVETE